MVDALLQRVEDGGSGGYGFVTDGAPVATTLTFSELYERARIVAAEIADHTPSGSRVVLMYPPGPDFVVALYGALLAGVVAVPVYPPSSTAALPAAFDRLGLVVADCSAELVLSTASLVAIRDAAGVMVGEVRWLATDAISGDGVDDWRPPRILGDDLAVIQYTSGSTGAPRGVVLRHRHILANLAAIQNAMGLTSDSVVVGWVPSYHDMGLIGYVLSAVHTGAWSYLIAPQDFLRRPAIWLETISRYRGTCAGGPNFGYELCTRRISPAEREDLDLSSWSVAFTGAEKVRADVLRRFATTFADQGLAPSSLYACYGLAEATLLVTGARPGDGARSVRIDRRALDASKVALLTESSADGVEVASCGRPASQHEVLIVDPAADTPLGPGQIGEVWVRGPSIAAGYWGRAEETDRVFGARLPDSSGPFLRTGDLGFLHDGELYLTGRAKDLLIISGRNIYPTDVEEAVQGADHRMRAGCGAAFDVSDDSGDRVVIVQETAEEDEAALRELALSARTSVARCLDIVPDNVVFIAPQSIPKTSSGKLRRAACRDDYLAGRLPVRYEWRPSTTAGRE
ncbi:fatty acyl-AMP ligase [Micromonospora sp. NPDC049662]|uniref:fatty acyl-AMP ligase n=1 Tax=Micromonospora sp. NPDC049662 TaxID=3155397 RepID=UPI00341E71D9